MDPIESARATMLQYQQRADEERNRWTTLTTATRENGKKLDRVIALLERLVELQSQSPSAPPGK